MSGSEMNQAIMDKEKEYHDRLRDTILDFTHEMNLRDVKIANQCIEILRLKKEVNDLMQKGLT